jgi:tetratricopeptide (TPR) repeat protein
MEQPEVAAAAISISIVPPRPPLSDDVRASLEAVRLAQEDARERARRETVRTRIGFATAVVAVVAVAFAFGPRAARWRHARAHAATPARLAPAAPAPALAAPTTAPSAAETVAAATPAEVKAHDAPGPAEGCDTGLVQSAPWRVSPEACVRAFEANPTNAGLALAIAQAEHARTHVAEAARWAKRAIALDPNVAEAYVLIARADTAGGRHDEAREAYRHYLDLAPRGWHHAEARAALRRGHATTADSAR